MFCHGCEGMHGITRDPFFFFPPSCYGISRGDGEEWEHFFLRPPLPALDGRPVTSGAVQQRTTLDREASQSHI